MKKVLYVFGGEKASGAEIVIQRLIDYNLTHVEPHLFIAPGRFADELLALHKSYPIIVINRLGKLNRSSTSVSHFFIDALKNYIQLSISVIRYVRKNDINIIHANTVVPASYLVPALLFCRFFYPARKWIWSDHDLQYFSKLDHLFSKVCAALYDKTLVVSEAVKAKFRKSKSVEVLYNGLDLEIYKPSETDRAAFRNELKCSDEKIVFSIAGTISPRKGHLPLIKVFKHLLSSYLNIILVIAGAFGEDDIGYNTKVKNEIECSSNIFYLGHVTNTIPLYCGSDVIINNSNKRGGEPLGTTIYEAMACQKVVVASNVGGTVEIIDDGEDGFIFKAEDEESLKDAMEKVIKQINSLDKVRSSARRKTEKKFNIITMANHYNKFIS
jgi:glycosyltransferase involved in cell wall biosynthesis